MNQISSLLRHVLAPVRAIIRREKILWLIGGFGIGFAIFLLDTRSWSNLIEAREAAGKTIKFEHQVRESLWDLGLIGMITMVVMLGLLGFLFWSYARERPWLEEPKGVEPSRLPQPGRNFWLAMLGILVVATMLRAPRMGLSIYNDEEYAFRRYVAGEFRHQGEPTVTFEPVSWARTIWYNLGGNNGYPYSVAARASYDLWRHFSGAPEGTVHEGALRLPALLAGLGSIVVIGLLVQRLGFSQAALAAAAFVALHPWHVRYSTEARAYALVFLFVALTLWALSRALTERRWRWWLLYGAFQMAYLYAFAGAVYLSLVMNALVFVHLILKDRRQILPLGISNGLAGIFLLFAMGPGLQQMIQRLDGYTGSFQIAPTWWPNMFCYQVFGMPFFNHYPESPANPAWLTEFNAHSILVPLGSVIVALCLAWGIWVLLRTRPTGWILVGTAALALPLAFLHMGSSGRFFHLWYTIDFLPIEICAVGAGIHQLTSRFGRWIPLVAVAGMASVSWLPLQSYLHQPKDNFRAAIEMMRGAVYPQYQPEKVLTAGFWTEANIYDPHMTPVKESADLDRLVARARAEQKPLYVTFARRQLALNLSPELVHKVESSGLFEKAGEFPGLEESQYTSYVYRLVEGPES